MSYTFTLIAGVRRIYPAAGKANLKRNELNRSDSPNKGGFNGEMSDL